MRFFPVPFALFLALLVLLPGCGKSSEESDPEKAQKKTELEDIYEMYRLHIEQKKRTPGRLTDLRTYEIAYPSGYVALQNNQYTVFWGVELDTSSAGASRVLAYEASAPTEGGMVLMHDGAIRSLTADEAQAALKIGR